MNTLPVDEPKGLVYEAYKKRATDQRKKDIDKACEWLKNKVTSFVYVECEDAWDATCIFDTNALIESFRKATEKEQ